MERARTGLYRDSRAFDKVAEEAESYFDVMAERTGGLGGMAYGTIHMTAERSYLISYPLGIADEHKHIFAVAGALVVFGPSVREAIDQASGSADADTDDRLAEISRDVDHQLWFVESHVAPK